jgi:pimeloyl-ACP methyl ester carboxylesterase
VPRLVFVHGSLVGGRATWREQRQGIGDAAELVVLERPRFEPPGTDGPTVPGFSQAPRPADPPRVDFDDDAVWVADILAPGDHLVGHSYGGVVALLAAALDDGRLASLTVIEPPATQVALDVPDVAAFAQGGADLWANGPRDDPEAFMRAFLAAVGSDFDPPVPLPPQLLHGARLLAAERGPWEAEIPLATLAARRLPTLAVSGGHHPAFEAICDRLEEELDAERAVLPGFGHNAQLHPEFNRVLLDFVVRTDNGRDH